MMPLCIDARMISCSGIGTFLKNLIPYFSPQETLLLLYAQDLKKHPWLSQYPFRLCHSPIYSLAEQKEIPFLVPRCELFWSPHYNVPIFPLRAKKRVVTIHDAAHLAFGKSLGWKKHLYARLLFQQAASRSDLIISDSLFSQQELASYLNISAETISVVYPGVDLARFTAPLAEDMKQQLQKKYNLPCRFFLFIGNLKPHKNLKLIVDSYRQDPFLIPTVAIGKIDNLLSPDPLVSTIKQDPKLSQQILFTGEVPDEEIPSFYKMADALIFPSLYEGFGLPPLEAMASDCPVIASSAASIPEVCGNAAYLVDPLNSEELLQALKQMSSSLEMRTAFKLRGQERILRFSWNKTAEHYTSLLQQLRAQ